MFVPRSVVTASSGIIRKRWLRSATTVMKSSFSDASLEKTALFDYHQELGGKMVPFAGYSLPVQYAGLGKLIFIVVDKNTSIIQYVFDGRGDERTQSYSCRKLCISI